MAKKKRAPKKKRVAKKGDASLKKRLTNLGRALRGKKGDYHARLVIGDQAFDAYGPTLIDAMRKWEVPKMAVKTYGTITVDHKDGRKADMIFYVIPLRRLLANGIAMQIWAKRLEIRMVASK